MEEERIFLNIQVPKGLNQRIDDFRFNERKPFKAEAVRQLIEMGLRVYEKSTTRVSVAATKA